MSIASPADDQLGTSVGRVTTWLRTMLVHQDGHAGIWERLRLDRDEVVYWVRPDCTAEAMHLFDRYAELVDEPELAATARQMSDCLLRMQAPDGGFPFYRYVPPVSTIEGDRSQGDTRYPNDNGKILEMLAYGHRRRAEPSITSAVHRLADHLAESQQADGSFRLGGHTYRGACFTSWPAIGLTRAYGVTHDETHRTAALRAVDRLLTLRVPGGRVRTSYEESKIEDWRPPSSETAEALRAFALAHRLLEVDLSEPIAGAVRFLRRLSTPEGAIRNCDEESSSASLQRDPSLTDLVYTDGYALHAWLDTARATGSETALEQARKLARFLTTVQCADAQSVHDGAWRGSYDVDRRGWRGRSNQNNPIDEGGAHSVYTGWCNATIANGMIRLLAANGQARCSVRSNE